MMSVFIGGSVLCATIVHKYGSRIFLGHANLYSFCSAEHDKFQKNSIFFGEEISKSAIKVGEPKI